MMDALKPLGREMAARLVAALGGAGRDRGLRQGRAGRPGRRAGARRALARARRLRHARPARGLARDRAVDDQDRSRRGDDRHPDPPPRRRLRAQPLRLARGPRRRRAAARRDDAGDRHDHRRRGRTPGSAACGQTRLRSSTGSVRVVPTSPGTWSAWAAGTNPQRLGRPHMMFMHRRDVRPLRRLRRPGRPRHRPGRVRRRRIKPGPKSALIVVDVQNCFVDGGTLPVKGGAEVVPVINKLSAAFENVVVTQDWHTPGHVSFASAHAGKKPFETTRLAYGTQVLWPDHCVQGSRRRRPAQGPGAAEGAAHHQEGLPPGHRQLLGLHRGRRQDRRPDWPRYLRAHGVDDGLRLRPGHRFLRRLDRARRAQGRLQGVGDRGRVARHRPQRLAQGGLGQDGQGRRQAHPVERHRGLSLDAARPPPVSRPRAGAPPSRWPPRRRSARRAAPSAPARSGRRRRGAGSRRRG